MRRFTPSIALAGIVVAVWALAPTAGADDTSQNADQNGAVSEANAVSINQGGLKDESVALKPQVGVLNFHDSTANQTQRGAIGLAAEFNFSKIVSGVANNVYFGLSTGALYSHIGEVGSNFFGTSSSTSVPQGSGGANLLLFPVDAKLGYNFTDSFRVSAHGGGNVIYNSVPSTINWGSASSRNWNMMPNVGGDVDIGISKSVALTLRPDWTFTPGTGFFTGTLEFGFSLG